MRMVALIVRRELGAFFRSPLGFIILSTVLLLDGLLFNAYAMGSEERRSSSVLMLFFYFSSGTTLVASIVISMRLLAEERQTGSAALILSAPVSEAEIVIGKFLSAWIFLAIITVSTLYMPLLIFVNGSVTVGQICAGYLGLLVLGAAGAHLAALAWGRDPRPVMSRVPDKSIGAEETFAADVDDPVLIRRELLRLSERTARGLRAGAWTARTVVVKLRLANFKTITRSKTLPEPTDVAQQIYRTACALYAGSGLDTRARLRLVGVRATGLIPAGATATQLAFGEEPASWRDAEQAVDKIAGRFGPGTVRPAVLVRDTERGGPLRGWESA